MSKAASLAKAPLIAIVGRPNVGKSTLFNRLVGGRPALVHDTPGLTRDRRYGDFMFDRVPLRVVDTGGLDPEAQSDVVGAGIHRQAWRALEEADAVIFVVDATAGVTALDQDVAQRIRRAGKPMVCAANKVDNPDRIALVHEMHALGLGEVFPITAAHGRGVEELIEHVLGLCNIDPDAYRGRDADPEDDNFDDDDDGLMGALERSSDPLGLPSRRRDRRADAVVGPLRVAFFGKPNAGKSSLLNRLIGEERSLVHHEPGTTMDPVDSPFEFAGKSYVLVDTAGVRRRARVYEETEKIAVSVAIDQLRRADVAVLVIDANEGASEQDAKLANLIEESGRAVVIALNKIDLIDGPSAISEVKKELRESLHFIAYAPFAPISALRGDGVEGLIGHIDEVARQHRRRISTSELNTFFSNVVEVTPPPLHRGITVRLHYLTQAAVAPPTFVIWANKPEGLSPQYKRFLVNKLRENYRFAGAPVRLVVKAKRKVDIRERGDTKPRGKRRS